MSTTNESKTTAIAVIDNFQLPAMSDEMGQALAEEMDGLQLTFPRVKIPSGGGLAFEVPGNDPENPDTEKELVGVIVDHHPVNGYWPEKYSGGNTPPECSSLDGKVGINDKGNRQACNSCPNNTWGSDEEGHGKACKNMHRVYILRQGENLPLLLTLPPTSLKNISDYLGLRIVTKGMRSYGVVTKVTLKKAQNTGGINYSQAVFALAGKLPPEQVHEMAEYAQGIKVLTRQLAVNADEFAQTSNNRQDDDIEYSGNEEEFF